MTSIHDFWIQDTGSIAALSAFIKPFLGLIVFALVIEPIKRLIDKLWEDSPLKRDLFQKHYSPMEIKNGMVPKAELERLKRESIGRKERIEALRHRKR
jgi:hypothetical protein